MKTYIFFFLVCCFMINNLRVSAQNDTINNDTQNLYRTHEQRMETNPDSSFVKKIDEKAFADSIARVQFIRDSVIAREKFVRDSLLHRKHIRDSVYLLKNQLPALLTATLFTKDDNVIIKVDDIEVVGDSVLTDLNYLILPNRFVDPYRPWEGSINLSNKPIGVGIDTIKHRITSLNIGGENNMFSYPANNKLIIIKKSGRFTSKYGKKYYRAPIDSVFYDAKGNLAKIKRYYIVYEATENFKLGKKLFVFKWQVKQFGYSGNNLSSLEVVKYGDRWNSYDPEKIGSISDFTFATEGYGYKVERKNDPVNKFSDGVYNYEFDNIGNLKTVTFRNTSNTENWKTFIEQNEQGYVSRYVYKDKGIVSRTLLVNYYLDDPNAKYKVETVTCTFEDDGISYYQHNNTTGKSRRRDKFTAEWGPWE